MRDHGDILCTWTSHLKNQDIFRRIGLLRAKVLNFVLIAAAQVVKPQAVFFRVHDLAELRLQAAALGRVQQTFKDRVLHTLAIIDTLFCNLPQTLSTCCILCVYVISDQN